MTISEAMERVCIIPCAAIRHGGFPRPSSAVYLEGNRLIYRMAPNSIGWDWKPSQYDLIRTDWYVVDGGSR